MIVLEANILEKMFAVKKQNKTKKLFAFDINSFSFNELAQLFKIT